MEGSVASAAGSTCGASGTPLDQHDQAASIWPTTTGSHRAVRTFAATALLLPGSDVLAPREIGAETICGKGIQRDRWRAIQQQFAHQLTGDR